MILRPVLACSLAFTALAPALLAQSASTDAPANTVEQAPAPSWAKDTEPMAVPDNAQGALFYRRQDTIAHLTQTGSRSYQSQLVRMLQPQALQAGNIALTWNQNIRRTHHNLYKRRQIGIHRSLEVDKSETPRVNQR